MDTLVYNKLLEIKSFNNILHPLSIDQFESKYWEKNLLVIQRNNPSFYNSLFQIDNVDQVLDVSRPKGNSLRVVKNQVPMLPTKYENQDGSLNLNQLYAAYADGYTIVINDVDRFWQPLRTLCRNITSVLSHYAKGNVYLTPKNEKALLPHYDTHDVYVLQIHGKKNWILYDTPMETPLLNSHQPIFKREQLSNPREITLNAGDLMYMPRGLPHEAYTTDESSVHITIGIYPAQWVDLITKSVESLAYQFPEMRKALPVGFLNAEIWSDDFTATFNANFQEILKTVFNSVNVTESTNILREELRTKQIPNGDGHFHQIDNIDALTLDTKLEKRPGLNCTVQVAGIFCRIIFPGNVIKGPARIAQTLQFVSDAKQHFMLKDLPGLSDTNKIKLAARLIRGGLLRFKD